MTETIVVILAALTAVWFIGARALRGPDLRRFDAPNEGHATTANEQRFSTGDAANAEHMAITTALAEMQNTAKRIPLARRLAWLRHYMDTLFASHPFEARFVATDAGGVPAEWVLAPGADGGRRTLYIHGGAFVAGSRASHRVITARFSEITGGAVLAIDYRLLPEHSRMAGIEDCRSAYRWMLVHGPDGAQPPSAVFVAGDSAGGNLTLSLIAWVRDQGLRAPDAAVALSPATDTTFGSPSLRANVATDTMLGPLLKPLTRIPRSALLWTAWFQNRKKPNDPIVSPVFGDLSNLPPVLVHASAVEMLVDDSRRYVNKAVAAGSPVRLQTWNHMVHVWHIFDPGLTESRQAFEEIRKFIAEVAPPERSVAAEATLL